MELKEKIANIKSGDDLIEYIEELGKRRVIDFNELNKEITRKGVQYNLPTIASEIFKEASRAKTGSFQYIKKGIESKNSSYFKNNIIVMNFGI